MLVLGRFVNQSVTIGNDLLRISVADIRRSGLVRLGLEACPSIKIFRTELLTGEKPDKPCSVLACDAIVERIASAVATRHGWQIANRIRGDVRTELMAVFGTKQNAPR